MSWALVWLSLAFNLVVAISVCDGHFPAMFVMGDSLVDNGNNNGLSSLAKSNYPPYGIDFQGGSTGRFTNGKTIIDLLGTHSSLYHLLCMEILHLFRCNQSIQMLLRCMHSNSCPIVIHISTQTILQGIC